VKMYSPYNPENVKEKKTWNKLACNLNLEIA
jgi:hypothetical protein